MSGVANVTDSTFEQEVLKSDIPVLVDFWAPWCGPCKAVAPVVEDLSKEFDGRLKVVKLNTDENPKTAQAYTIRGIPSLYLFSHYFNSLIAVGLGVIYLIGREIYAAAYVKDPAKRSAGYGLSFLPIVVLIVGAVIGAVRALIITH